MSVKNHATKNIIIPGTENNRVLLTNIAIFKRYNNNTDLLRRNNVLGHRRSRWKWKDEAGVLTTVRR